MFGKISVPLRTRHQDPQHIAIETAAGPVTVAVRRNRSARRMVLRVRPATAEPVVTLPMRTTLAAAERFVDAHADWIVAELARLGPRAPLCHGALVPLRGCDVRIHHDADRRGAVRLISDADDDRLSVPGDGAFLERRIRDWLKREARRDLCAAVDRHCRHLGRSPVRIGLRDTTSRWGSCSTTGALSFSWRLVMAPPFVLDYVAAHEVAHLVHMDHSPRFWAVVDRLYPDREAAQAWLKANGHTLHRAVPRRRAG